MSEQNKADIKQAYQAAAEITYIIAVGLSQAKPNRKRGKFTTKRHKQLEHKEKESAGV